MKKWSFGFADTFLMLSIVGIILLSIVGGCGITIYDQTRRAEIQNATVIDLQQQQKISGSGNKVSTEIRFIVITDAETFIVGNSLLNGKFDNSNIFFRLEKGKKYDFNVAGIGKGFFTDYRNILSYSCR